MCISCSRNLHNAAAFTYSVCSKALLGHCCSVMSTILSKFIQLASQTASLFDLATPISSTCMHISRENFGPSYSNYALCILAQLVLWAHTFAQYNVQFRTGRVCVWIVLENWCLVWRVTFMWVQHSFLFTQFRPSISAWTSTVCVHSHTRTHHSYPLLPSPCNHNRKFNIESMEYG